MSKVTALGMDRITENGGHTVTPLAVSVCTTPAAPSPIPVPYPVVASVSEGIGDAAMRTKINGAAVATVGSVLKTCHGNEPGTLKEAVRLNTSGPVFLIPLVSARGKLPAAALSHGQVRGGACIGKPPTLARKRVRSLPGAKGPLPRPPARDPTWVQESFEYEHDAA